MKPPVSVDADRERLICMVETGVVVSPDGAKGGVLSVMANAHDTKAKHPTVMHAPIAMIPEVTGRIAIYIRGSTWSDKAMYVFIRDFRFTFDLNSPSGPNGLALEGLAGFGPQCFQRRRVCNC